MTALSSMKKAVSEFPDHFLDDAPGAWGMRSRRSTYVWRSTIDLFIADETHVLSRFMIVAVQVTAVSNTIFSSFDLTRNTLQKSAIRNSSLSWKVKWRCSSCPSELRFLLVSSSSFMSFRYVLD